MGSSDQKFAVQKLAGQHVAAHAARDERDRLIYAHIPLARSLARRFANRGEQLEDLEQVAMSALVASANRFDSSRDVKFSTFATSTILGTLKRHFRDARWGVHVNRSAQERYLAVRDATDHLTTTFGRAPTPGEVGLALGIEPEEVVDAREAEAAAHVSSLDAHPSGTERFFEVGADDTAFAAFEARADVARALATLGERELEVIRLRFVDGLTQAEIGARLGVSQMQVSRLLTRSLAQVRSSLYG